MLASNGKYASLAHRTDDPGTITIEAAARPQLQKEALELLRPVLLRWDVQRN